MPELIGSFHLPVRSKKRTLLVLLLCLCKSFKEQLLNANAKFIAKASAKVYQNIIRSKLFRSFFRKKLFFLFFPLTYGRRAVIISLFPAIPIANT